MPTINVPADHGTIQAAIDAASEGDTVMVSNGNYPENVTLKDGVSLVGESEAGVVIQGSLSTPPTMTNMMISNLTVHNATQTDMLLDMKSTASVTDVVFDHVTFSLTSDFVGEVPIGNGQVAGTIAIHDGNSDGVGLTFQHVTMASNNRDSSASVAFVYTTVESVAGAKMVLDDVTLSGTASGSSTGLGAQWNMTPPSSGSPTAVEIVNSHTSGGGNFYVSGFDSVVISDNTFDGQGLALNGVDNATVTGNTFQNIDGSITANGTQHRGLVIEDAWGTDGVSNVTVTDNDFVNISVEDGAIAFQRFTGGSETATVERLNDVDIHGNTFTGLGSGVPEIYVNPTYFGAGAVLPADFDGDQVTIGTAGDDPIVDGSSGDNSIFVSDGNDTVTGGEGDDTIDGGVGEDMAVYTGDVSVAASGDGWIVDGGVAEGADTLSNVEVVSDAEGQTLLVGNGGFATVQAAIDASADGDTIMISAGTYTGNINVNKSVTIVGVGDAEDIVIEGTFKTDNGIVGSVAEFMEDATAYTGAAGAGLTVSADNVTIENLTITSYLTGIELGNGVDHTTIQGVTIDGTVNGIRKGSGALVSDLDVIGGEIRDGVHGVYFAKETAATGQNITDVTFDGAHFENLIAKGIYAETLNGTTLFDNLTMDHVGEFGRGDAFGNIGEFGNGIDINLKFGAYTGSITIEGFTFTNVGNSTGADPTGHLGGAAIAVKARNDSDHPVYGPDPADASGLSVVIQNGSIDGTSTGVRLGEPGKSNPSFNTNGPDVTVTNVTIDNNLTNAKHNDFDNVSQGTLTVNGTAVGDTYTAVNDDTSTGDIVFNGLGGDDVLTSAGGNDTLTGGDGNDQLDGGAGADTMSGGDGNDTYHVDDVGDTVVETENEGVDEVVTAESHTLADNVENLTLTDLDSNTQTFDDMAPGPIANGENGWKDAGPADDQEIVDESGNHVWRISSSIGSGDFGGPYTPALSVTAGEPQTTADAAFQSIKFRIKPVNDTPDDSRIEVDFANTGGTDRNNFMVIESTGTGIRIAVNEPLPDGNWANNSFTPFTGNRELVSGIDPTVWHDIELRLTYVDGADNDVIGVYLDGELIGATTTFENYRDVLGGTHEANAEANQTSRIIFRGGTTTPGEGFYFDDVGSTVAHNASGTGNALNNVITGNSGDNALSGLEGDDTILGGDGNDTITGGTGTDDLSGDAGDDSFVETIGEGVDEIDGGTGTDTLELVGTAGDDAFTANVDGGSLTNPGETLTSVENITLDLGDGAADTLSYAGTTEGVTVDLSAGEATGFDSIAGVENVTGGDSADSLTGNAGANVLVGGGGDDTLDGGAGTDTAQYSGTATVSMSGGGWSVAAGAEGTDTLANIERVDDAGDGQILLVGNGGYATIQDAIDVAADGDTILIADGIYEEALSIDGKAITLQAAGEDVVVQAPAGTNAIALTGDFEGGNVSILSIEIEGAAALPNQGMGVYVTEGANVGTLTLDGVDIHGAGSYGVFVNGDDRSVGGREALTAIVITNSSFSNNGYNGANGAAHIKLFGFAGDAAIQNVTIDNAAPDTPVAQRPDYGIELTGTVNTALSGSNAVAMGTVVIDNVSMTGWLHKNAFAVFNYGNIDGLAIGAGDLDLEDVVTDWGPLFNIDGILDDIDASGYGVLLPTSTISTELQGDKAAQTATNQTIIGTNFRDRLIGKGGDDMLLAGAGDDELYGADKPGEPQIGDTGNDWLDGGTGADTMTGGAGDDTYVVDDEGDQVVEAAGEGDDTVNSSVDYVLGGNVENLTLTGAAINGTGNGLDNVIVGNDQDNVLDGQGGNDEISGGLGDDQLLGGAADDQLSGGDGTDLLVGGTGNDQLDGGTGADIMFGGSGDDTFTVDEAGDSVNESAGQGTDTVRSSISYTLATNFENLELLGSTNINGTGNAADNDIVGNAGDNTLDGGVGADTMAGGAGNDSYVVDNLDDDVNEAAEEGTDQVTSSVDYALGDNFENLTLTGAAVSAAGNAQDNVIIGNAQDNVIDGGAGADTMSGGDGGDTYHVDSSGDEVIETAGNGNDTVISSVTFSLAGQAIENLTLIGPDNINGLGNELDNTIAGNIGDNLLNGRAGADTMIGGVGNDSYVVDDVGDAVTELAGEGTDEVTSSVDYVLGDNLENLTLAGSAVTGTGNAVDNVIIGNASNNVIDGGAGADRMKGGAGDDTYYVDNSDDKVIETVSNGIDTVQSSVGFSLADQALENLILTGAANVKGTGNELDNHITGNAGDNTLDGRVGADTMIGGEGNDSYLVDDVGDVVTELGGEGTDQVTSSVDYVLGDDLENLTLTGSAVAGTGNASNNVIIGSASNNVIDGSAGADKMRGGAGNDTYYVDNSNDKVFETAGNGVDTVTSLVSFSLAGQAVENLTLAGSARNGHGNELDNVLVGNAERNTLTGGAGHDALDGGAKADTMVGGDGNDSYAVDSVGDVVTEAVGEGTDHVTTSVSHTLSANVENLTLVGAATTGTGNELANEIVGNALDNVLDGGVGADTLTGGTGNDAYIVDDSGDVVIELDGEGIDHVTASASYSLSANVEHLTLTGTATQGVGNALDNQIVGNDQANLLDGDQGNDALDGGSGADTMAGGAGDDSYIVDNVGDVVNELAEEGADHVTASVSYTLSANVENLTLIGSSTDGTGNELDNQIVGNDQDNSLDGAGGSDTLSGNDGNDALTGGLGNDDLDGGANDDLLLGGAGDDHIAGGEGLDILNGGTGHDTFVFDTAPGPANVDMITDFTLSGANSDLFALSESVFSAFEEGAMSEEAFSEHIIYNQATGALSYDEDGDGGGEAVQFATLTTRPALTHDQFVVV